MHTLEQVRAALRAKLALRAASTEEMDQLLATPTAEARDLTHAESARFAELRDALSTMDEDIDGLKQRERDLMAFGERKAEASAFARSMPLDPKGLAHGIPGAYVRRDEQVYRPDTEHRTSFLADVVLATQYNDPRANERLMRNDAEARSQVELRDIGVSAMSGFVPPQYLREQFAALARSGRPFADLLTGLPLPPEGMTVNISRITTGTAVAAQATENSAVQETNADDALLTVNVNTIAGQQDVSFQALQRSGGFVDSVLFADLTSAYNVELDRQCINGAGSSGEHLGVLNVSSIGSVTYTDASPTASELWPKIADAVNTVQTARYVGPTAIVMHPRRWNWLLTQRDADGRPIIVPVQGGNVPHNAGGVALEQGYGKQVGFLFGTPVFTDASVPTNLGGSTNEDRIIVAAMSDIVLWEDSGAAPVQVRYDAPGAGSLTGKLVVYGFSALAAGRHPSGICVISGTGLATPAFA